MAEGFIGEIRLFAGNFAPRGWALCQGQLLPISQNTALFSILGTTYGGDGRVTFGLPDLRGRVAMGPGQGPGLTSRDLGEVGGTESVTLLASQLPAHSHPVNAFDSQGNSGTPVSNFPAADGTGFTANYNNTANGVMAPGTVGPNAGGGQPHNNVQPYLVLTYIICMEGIFPSRN